MCGRKHVLVVVGFFSPLLLFLSTEENWDQMGLAMDGFALKQIIGQQLLTSTQLSLSQKIDNYYIITLRR